MCEFLKQRRLSRTTHRDEVVRLEMVKEITEATKKDHGCPYQIKMINPTRAEKLETLLKELGYADVKPMSIGAGYYSIEFSD